MRRTLGALALLALAACSDLVSPRRDGIYEYRRFQNIGAGAIDTVTFHWPRNFLPVRVWVADDDPLLPHTITAVARWNGAFLYGEFRAELVADSNHADIIVRNVESSAASVIEAERFALDAFAPQCRGVTPYEYETATHVLTLPLRVFVWSRFGSNVEGLDTCYQLTTTHELGHALGILNHSTDIGDVMAVDPLFNGLSERDRKTAETVYHLRSVLTPGPRR